jgi:hypothetical protein
MIDCLYSSKHTLRCREIRLHIISASVIEMWNGRDLIEFRSTGNGIYTDGNGLSLSSSGDGNKVIGCLITL